MMFKKEVLLNKIAELGDYNTIQYISQSSFFIPLIFVWLITLIVFLLLAFIPNRPNLWVAFIVAMLINLCGLVLVILGVLPSVLTFSGLTIT